MRHPGKRRWQQCGMGLMGLLVTINLIAFFMTLLLKLGPLDVQFWTVRSILRDVAASSEIHPTDPHELSESLVKRLNVNGIAGIGAKHFKIEKQDKATDRIAFANERRVHLFDNLDAVARFDHQVMVKTH